VSSEIKRGDYARDTSTNQVGMVIDIFGRTVMLKPVGGGEVWDADRRRVEPATLASALLEQVREYNEHNRGMRT
jgi:hypothetical protein